MKNKAIRYEAEFKVKALTELRSGHRVYKLARQLGISPTTLKRWQKASLLEEQTTASVWSGNSETDQLQRRILRLEDEKRVLKEALHVLLRVRTGAKSCPR